MKMNKRGGSKLPVIITAAALIVVAGVFALVYFLNKPKPDATAKDATFATATTSTDASQAQKGAKAYTFTVVGKDGSSKDYAGRTDAAYLKDLMDDMTKNGELDPQITKFIIEEYDTVLQEQQIFQNMLQVDFSKVITSFESARSLSAGLGEVLGPGAKTNGLFSSKIRVEGLAASGSGDGHCGDQNDFFHTHEVFSVLNKL